MIYAKTLNPEGFDFNAYEDEFNEVFIKGRDYALNDKPVKFIDNMKAGYENDYVEDYYEGDMRAYINNTLMDKKDGTPYTEDEAKRIKMALDNHVEHDDLVKLCLGIAMGEGYDYMMIQGSTQREWAMMYYPKSYSEDATRELEALFFNTGVEVTIYDGDGEPASADDVHGHSFYCTRDWDTFVIKSEIAYREGCNPEDVKLFVFKGYRKIEEYESC